MEASGIILAGGLSSRMGWDKNFLKYYDDTLVERAVREMHKVVTDVIIASNHTSKYGIAGTTEILDIYTGMGPLAGIHAGLQAAPHPVAFVVAADMPLFDAQLASFLLSRSANFDVVVPQIYGRWEPLCAVYSRECLKPIETCLQADIKQITRFYPQVRVLSVNADELEEIGKLEELFYNVNTPEDYNSLLQKLDPGSSQRRSQKNNIS